MFACEKDRNRSSAQVERIRLYTWMAAIVWTVLIAGSFVWNYRVYEEQILAVSRVKALTAFEWGRLYRAWVSRKGGIYVPVTPDTPANPLLSHVPERDVTTPSGRTLTLMNAAYMTHQVFDSVDKPEELGRGRITSLNPINPANLPDPWEEKALRAFEKGVKEASEIQVVNGRSYLRLLKVSITEKPCLQCHGRQGYKVGDIRGGVGVTVPISDILDASRPQVAGNALVHGVIWMLGLGILWTGRRKLTGSVVALQESKERYRVVVEDQTEVICRLQADGTIVFANEVYCRFFGKSRQELLGNRWQPLAFPDDISMIEERLGEMTPANPVVIIENRVYSGSGQVHWMQFINRGLFDGEGGLIEIQSVGRDITERRQAEDALADARDELENQVQERTVSLTMANQQLHLEIEGRKRIEQDILDHQRRLQAMTRELALAEERERDRIARELHDQAGQRLILGKMKLDSLASRLPSGQFACDAEEVGVLLDQSIQDIRSLTFQLRPPILANAGLEAAVQWLGEEFRKDFGLQIEFDDDDKPKPMKYEVRSTVFQVMRELLLNIAKHAGAKRVKVGMKRERDSLVINVDDDGVGFDASEVSKREPKEGGFGLFSITQRIEYLGGCLSIETSPGKGTHAAIMVPLEGGRAGKGETDEIENPACR